MSEKRHKETCADLKSRIATLTAENERLRAEKRGAVEAFDAADTIAMREMRRANQAESDRDQALARVRALEAALEFYANPESYFAIGFFPDQPCGEFIEDFDDTELGYKPGKRARAALTEPAKESES